MTDVTTEAPEKKFRLSVQEEAEALAIAMYKAYRITLRAVRPLQAAVAAGDPYIGHPAQVAITLNQAAEFRRWWRIFHAAATA